MRPFFHLALVGIFLGSCANQQPSTVAAPAAASQSGQNPEQRSPQRQVPIIEGDRLEVTVREDQTFNGVYDVREGGHIMVNRIGRVQVSGLTLTEAEEKIRKSLQSTQLTKASVLIDRLGRAPRMDPRVEGDKVIIYLAGAVNRPGQHVLTLPPGQADNMGLYEAILITGGFGDFADLKKAYISRPCGANMRQKIPVNFKAIIDGTSPDPTIGNGDVITIPTRKLL
jgi:protein involved in polysaccharide export with SLBB domain